MKFQCIKGMATSDDIAVVMMQGDIVTVVSIDEGIVIVEGKAGWCTGMELVLTPKEFTTHFKYI